MFLVVPFIFIFHLCAGVYTPLAKVFLVSHFLSHLSLGTLRNAEPEPVVAPLKARCIL